MYWFYLVLAGLFEIGWPVGLKVAQKGNHMLLGIILAIVCIIASGFLLFLAQKAIHIGTAYAVWTGIGATGTFLIGIWFFSEPTSLIRYSGILFIIIGIVLLKLAG